jgi:hypothetical protein
MNRRTYLAALVAGSGALGGGIALADLRPDPEFAYREDDRVVSERDDLRLRALSDPVRLGDSVAFEVTNTGNSQVVLGCQNPWALQRRVEGEWRHVTWTARRFYQMCASELSPGDSLTTRLELTEEALEESAAEVHADLRPGKYRFLLVGTSPSLATEFQVLDGE